MCHSAAAGALLLTLALAASGDGVPERSPWKAAWPQFRGPNRDDHSPDTKLLRQWPAKGPALVWEAKGIGRGFSGVAVASGRIFTLGDEGDSSSLFALDQTTGKSLWEAKLGNSGSHGGYEGTRGTPTVDGDVVYAINQHGDLVCCEAATGKERWRKSFPRDFKGQMGGWGYAESPLVDGDKLVCTPGGREAALVALDKNTGAVIWKTAAPKATPAGYASMVIAEVGGVRQYVQLLGGGLIGVAAKDGKLLWHYDKFAGNTANIPTPVVLGDHIFAAVGYSGKGAGALLRLVPDENGVRAEEVYSERALLNKHGGVVQVGDYLYGDRDDGGHPYCAEWRTGKIVPSWQKRGATKGRGSMSVTYADGHLYCRYQNGHVALVEATPEGCREKGSLQIPNTDGPSWAHPVVIGGRLYLREQESLWCYDVKAN